MKEKSEIKMKKGSKSSVIRVLIGMLAAMLILSLSACSSDAKIPGFDVSVRSADSETNDNNTPDNNNSNTNNNNSNSNNNSNNNNNNNSSTTNENDLVSAMTPPNSVVHERVSGEYIIMTSTQSYNNLVTFYEAALKSVGAKETACIKGPDTKEWGYSGKYGTDQKNISIVIAPWQNEFRIGVAYDEGHLTMTDLPSNSVLRGKKW